MTVLLSLTSAAIWAAPPAGAEPPPEVRLVLQITVDGLRGDLLDRYGDRFGEGGFRSLLERGTVYTNAHHEHANTETIVGHATLATGAHPSGHGMVGNVWYDREADELAYNIEDPEGPLLPTRPATFYAPAGRRPNDRRTGLMTASSSSVAPREGRRGGPRSMPDVSVTTVFKTGIGLTRPGGTSDRKKGNISREIEEASSTLPAT